MRPGWLRLGMAVAALALTVACTHRIESPDEPIRIEMTVNLKHEHWVRTDQPGG